MEALPGFAAVAEAEEALSRALAGGGFRNGALAVVSAAREARFLSAEAGICAHSRAIAARSGLAHPLLKGT